MPGHTRGHIAYWFADSDALFCGDTLFLMGCGRLFEGTPGQMWTRSASSSACPDGARLLRARVHAVERALRPDRRGGNPALVARAQQVAEARARGEPTVPGTLAEEPRPTRSCAPTGPSSPPRSASRRAIRWRCSRLCAAPRTCSANPKGE